MTMIYLWENHVDKIVQKLLDILDTKQHGEDILMKVDYSLRVMVGELEKMILLCIIFGMAGYLADFLSAFGVIILLRTSTGGFHRNTMLGCFLQTGINLSIIVFLGNHIMLESWKCVSIVVIFVVLTLCFAPIQSENRIHYGKKQRLEFKLRAIVRVIVILLSGMYILKEQNNIMMFAVFVHTLEMAFLCVRIRKKEVTSGERVLKAGD